MNITVAAQLRQAASQLPAECARLEVELLLSLAMGKSRSWLLAWPDSDIPPADLEQFQQLLERRLGGEPVAYILGEQEFWSLPLQVTTATLVPRPDTEVMVEAVLADFAAHETLKVMDAGTGSGAIALALAKERPAWQVFACDASMPALHVARANASRLCIPVAFANSDWLQACAVASLDVVVSNPPYIAEGDSHLAALQHEPLSALVAADQGLADIRVITRQAWQVLRPGGALYVEHGYDQASAVRAMFESCGFTRVITGKDYAGTDRFTSGVKTHE